MNFSGFIFIFGIIAIMYFLMIRPQRKRAAERTAMLSAADIGDEIATVGGIVGKIVAVEEPGEIICIEVDSDVELRVQRRAIGEIITSAGGQGADDPPASDGVDESE